MLDQDTAADIPTWVAPLAATVFIVGGVLGLVWLLIVVLT